MTLINKATQKDVYQMKKIEYIKYTIELARFDYKDKVKTYHQIAKTDYKEEISTTPIYLFKNQLALQFKYFDNNGQEIKPKKAHEIDAEYDLQYLRKNTLVLQPKSLTKINLKITIEILPGAMVQIASQLSLASKKINIRRGIIDAEYTEDITIMLQNKIDKLFKIEHIEKIA
ncbi:hypothetical protein G9A89_003010 [Geosiphon pyriformis]|nr:hypothetical protein G9A89_003010 [Geosiphon pyriformis]